MVSILMPSLNQADFIAEAIDSVLGQAEIPRLELIVADGGSTDGTADLLARRAAADSRLRWDTQPDSGPAAAVNRALKRARGTLLGWLNADDRYCPGAIRRACDAFAKVPHWLMVYGAGEHIDRAGRPLGRYPTRPPTQPIEDFRDGCFICQPTVFFQRSLTVLLGPLDERLKTAFDFDYWLRAFKQFPERIGFIDRLQAQSRLHADCITRRQRRAVILEGMAVLTRHLGSAPKEWFQTYANEYLAAASAASTAAERRAHLEQTLAEAGPYLTSADRAALRDWVAQTGGQSQAVPDCASVG